MAFQNNILSFDGGQTVAHPPLLPERHRGLVERCRQVMEAQLASAMKGMFEALDDTLYGLADKADSNRMQMLYFDALRTLRKQREGIENSFGSQVRSGFARFWQYGPADSAPGGRQTEQNEEHFSLVDNAELEEALAVNQMVSRGENRHYQALYALHQRFGELLEGAEVDGDSNPLAPAALCGAFRDAVEGLELEVQVKLVLYKQFERRVVDDLGTLYQALNEVLVQAGILPKLARQVRRSPLRGLPDGGDGGETAARPRPESGHEGDDEALQSELFSALRSLLDQRRGAPAVNGVAARPALPVADSLELVQALSSLQQNVPPEQNGVLVAGADLRASLLQQIGTGENGSPQKRIDDNDEDAIDVISMLFEFILEDRNLPDAMKALLGRLQIPMLKVAILDRSFFSRKSHPARRLLNSMAQAAIGWSEEAGRGEGGLYARMNAIVERVLGGFADDISLFAELHDEFVQFLERERQGVQVTEQRAAQVTQGKEQLELARHRIASEIDGRIARQGPLPGVVERLLRDAWKDVLMLVYLRQGEESTAWQDALEVMDRLLWSITPKQEKAERQQLLEQIPPLLKRLRSGLEEISYDQHRMSELLSGLQRCHVACLSGNDPLEDADRSAGGATGKETVPAVQAAAVPETGGSAPAVAGSAATADDTHLRMARNLLVGDWLEVANEKGRTFRAKLSWRSRITGNSLFVSRKGLKVAELTLEELAEWFRSGKAVLLKDVNVPLLDRAMDAMVRSLSDGSGGS